MALLAIEDLVSVWASVISEVAVESPQHRAFLSLTKPLGLIEGGDGNGSNLLLSAPNDFAKDVLETRLRGAQNITAQPEHTSNNITTQVGANFEFVRCPMQHDVITTTKDAN